MAMTEDEAFEAIEAALVRGDEAEQLRLLAEEPTLKHPGGFVHRVVLLDAARKGDVNEVRKMLAWGGANARAVLLRTPVLHLATEEGHEDVVSLLLQYGASCCRTGSMAWTALAVALNHRRTAITRLMLKYTKPSEIDARFGLGFTAFYWACSQGYVEEAQAILLAGADHTIAISTGETPWQTVQGRHRNGCRMLIEWWEGELRRAYIIHQARATHEGTAVRQQAPDPPVPAYLLPRAAPGSAMPVVEVVAPPQEDEREEGEEKKNGQEGEETMAAEGGGKGVLIDSVDDEDEDLERGGGEDDDSAWHKREEGSFSAEEYYERVKVGKEEMHAVAQYVVKDLDGHLYRELLEGFHPHAA